MAGSAERRGHTFSCRLGRSAYVAAQSESVHPRMRRAASTSSTPESASPTACNALRIVDTTLAGSYLNSTPDVIHRRKIHWCKRVKFPRVSQLFAQDWASEQVSAGLAQMVEHVSIEIAAVGV